MKLKNYTERTKIIPEEVRRHVKHNLDILDRIHELLHEKFDGKQKLLAEKIGKTEDEVSKLIHGNYSFTLMDIAKLEAVFDTDILAVRSNNDEGTFD